MFKGIPLICFSHWDFLQLIFIDCFWLYNTLTQWSKRVFKFRAGCMFVCDHMHACLCVCVCVCVCVCRCSYDVSSSWRPEDNLSFLEQHPLYSSHLLCLWLLTGCLVCLMVVCLFVCLFETRSLLVAKRLVWPATLRTWLSLPLQHGDYRHEATHLALPMWVLQMSLSSSVFQSKYSTSSAIFPTCQLSNNDHKVVFSTYVNICGS